MDLSKVPANKRVEVKNEVGEFIVDEIFRNLSEGRSPVKGERFKRLSKDYAVREKGGDRTPNLELTSDMIESIGFKRTKEGIAVGIMKSKERPKADGHNNFSGRSKLPKRRFIPGKDQEFKTSITREVGGILRQESTATREGEGISVELRDIFSELSILQRLLRAGSS